MESMVSPSHVDSASPSSSEREVLMFLTWSAMGSLPQEHGAPEWVPSMVFSPLGTGCFSVGAPCSHTP